MGPLTKMLMGIVGFNMCLLYLLAFSSSSSLSSNSNLRGMTEQPVYKFQDPSMAYKIMSQLDIFEPNYNGYSEAEAEKKYQNFYLGLTADNNYCDKHRAYFANHPEYVFEMKNFITSYWNVDQIRNLTLNAHFTDNMPQVGGHRPWKVLDSYAMDMNLNVSVIITFEEMFYSRHVGKQFSCLGQMSNHIPGHDDLYRKDYAARAMGVYSKNYETRPQCFTNDKFFPKNYLLFEEDQCKEFFKVFNSEAYQQEKEEKGVVYMRKIGAYVHAGEGVFPVDQLEEDTIRELYQNGTACGKIKRNNIMQAFIHNPLLINGRKFDFRMFMLIASTNPFIAYYHDGFLRVTLQKYEPKGGDRKNLLTNTAVNYYAFDEAKNNGQYEGMTAEELHDDHMWTFDRFQTYLYEAGKITDPNWLDNYLRPEFKKAMAHLVRMSQKSYLKRSSLFEMYGVDFMLDDDFNLWFIEGNVRPAITGPTPDGIVLYSSVARGQFEIIFSLLRSRMKRILNYVNDLTLNGEAIKLQSGEVYISDLSEKIKEFKEVSRNHMEPEFEVGPENNWSKIVDENNSGSQKYMGLITEECL